MHPYGHSVFSYDFFDEKELEKYRVISSEYFHPNGGTPLRRSGTL
jgi:uncharacterized protein (DUF1330 family)